MLRLTALLAAGALALSGIALAAAVDRGPPYSNEQFLQISEDRVPNDFRKTLPEWWARAPEYLRKHILASPSDMWWPIILCNFMGFRPDTPGDTNSTKCEQDAYRNSQRGKKNWTADGVWLGPSEECRKRDKRTKWGELICD